MFVLPSFPWFELARFRRSRLTRAAIVAVLMVPLFYGALYVWANLNPTGNLHRVRAAVVNEDKIVQVTGADGTQQPVAVGRELAASLISNHSSHNYDWELTGAADAAKGLADGHYRAVLTIPENLSKAATSTSGDPADVIQGNLRLQTNDAINYINGTIAKTILQTARTTLNAQVTATYLDNVYLSFSDVKMSLTQAADGAEQLADGASQLADGAGRLHDGAGQLADGLGTLRSSTSSLPSDSRKLADGAAQVAAGTAQVDALVQQVSGVVTSLTDDADTRIDALKSALTRLADDCDAAATPGVDCARLRQAAADADQLRPIVTQVRQKAGEYSSQTARLSSGAAQVAAGNKALAQQAPALVDAIGQAADGANRLEDGSGRLMTGADRLHDGARTLHDKLSDGSEQVPDYTAAQRDKLAKTVATPITGDAMHANPVANYGEALAPYFMALALWVGAMAIYLLLRPLSQRAIASGASSARVAFAGFVPGAVLSVVQAVLLAGVLDLVVGVHAASAAMMFVIALATAVTFTAINQMLIAVLGPAGRFAAIVFVCLQLTAAGGTYPIETAPPFFGFLHGLLPMTYAVDAFRKSIAGSGVGIGQDVFALAVWTLLALVVTIIAAGRQRVVTIGRLHPTLRV